MMRMILKYAGPQLKRLLLLFFVYLLINDHITAGVQQYLIKVDILKQNLATSTSVNALEECEDTFRGGLGHLSLHYSISVKCRLVLRHIR